MRLGNERHESKEKDSGGGGERKKKTLHLCELKFHQNAKSTNKERTVFSRNSAGELDFHMQNF